MPYLTEVKTIRYGEIYIKFLKERDLQNMIAIKKLRQETDVDELD